MKKIFYPILAVTILLTLAVPSIADTIRLKDGSVIRGQVIEFKDQQFTVLIGGSKGRRSRTTIFVEDVQSIEFDTATTAAASALANEDTNSSSNASQTEATTARPTPSPEANDANAGPVSTPPISGASPTFFTIKVGVRADSANNGWTNSGLVVRKGQRLRISATGRVLLGRGRFSTPAGVSTIPDNDKLMRTEATGALIAVLGDDNDDFLLIGNRRDFVAQRDGVLFLGVNEGDLADNSGAYDVVIEAEAR